MRRAIKHYPCSESNSISTHVSITLSFDDRHLRRKRMNDDQNNSFLLDLPHAVRLCNGDVLELDDGKAIQVVAADEDVLDVICDGIEATATMAWHIGNRHTPIQVLEKGTLRIRYDHVLERMILDNGGICTRLMAPFSPEYGAYHQHTGEHLHAHS